MTINRKSFDRMSFTCRIKPQTKKWIEKLAAKFSEETDTHIALGVVVDRAIASMFSREGLSEICLAESAERFTDAANE